MDDKDFKIRASRLEKVAKVVEKLPVEIRNDAFSLLKGYVTENISDSSAKKAPAKTVPDKTDETEEAFFAAFDHGKPADNARLIAAYFYREYGVEPFSVEAVRQKADDVGITIPERIDMTYLSAKEKGKKLFTRAGTSKFKPTVHGEANLKATYKVKKGTQKRAETEDTE